MHTLIVCVCSCCIWIAEQWLKPLKALCCTMLYSVCYALMAFAFAFASELHFLLLEQWKNPNVSSTIKSSRIESINRQTLIQCQTAFSAIPNNLWAVTRMRESAATLMFNKYCNCITRFFHLSSALYILICRFSGVYVIWLVGSVGRTTFKFKQIEHTHVELCSFIPKYSANIFKLHEMTSAYQKQYKLNALKIDRHRWISYSWNLNIWETFVGIQCVHVNVGINVFDGK